MKILAYDHHTAGHDIEGEMLSCAGFHADRPLQGLVADLCRVQGADVTLLRDPRMAPLNLPSAVHVVPCKREHAADTLDACMQDADAVWPVVPETGGMLERASFDILNRGKLLIGSRPDVVRVAASKYGTAHLLKAAGIAVVDTCRLGDALPAGASAWVVKPDDGAGCSETRIFPDCAAACASIEERAPGQYVMQPYLHGAHRSMSLVCAGGRVLLMSVNAQRMAVFDNQLHYMGSTVNGVRAQLAQCRALAENVVAALPGLWGYVGIDFIMGDDGPVVLEVNPRVTVSHAAMRQATGHNPARLLLDLLQGAANAPLEARRTRSVSIGVNPFPDQTAGRNNGA